MYTIPTAVQGRKEELPDLHSLSSDTTELGEHAQLIVFSKVYKNVYQMFSFAVSTGLAADIAEFGERG